jgi:hypothetical protein
MRFSSYTTCLKRPPGVGMSARIDPQASRLVALRVLAEEADILEGDCDARSFEAVALERARELVVLAGVFRSAVGEHRIKEASAARVEPKGLCCAGDVVQLQADSLRFVD